MAGTGKLTDTQLLSLISQTTHGSPNIAQCNKQEHELPASDNNDAEGGNLEKASKHQSSVLGHKAEKGDVQPDTLMQSDSLSQMENSSADFSLESSQSMLQSSLIVPVQPVSQSVIVSSVQIVTQSDLTCPVQTVSKSKSDIVKFLQAVPQSVPSSVETVPQSKVTLSKDVTQSGLKLIQSKTSSVLQSQSSSEPGSQLRNTSDRLGPPIDVKSPSYKIDTELVSMLSQDEIISLVHEYRTELESTKKKLERSERQLTKANDYNDVLRNMVEKLSSEIHQVKHGKTYSVHVQVDKDDFLNYTTGRSTMPTWNTEDDHQSAEMDISQTSEVLQTPMCTSMQQPGGEMDTVSIADSIKQAAEAVVQQQQADMLHDRGYVYDEHSGLYYHSASGYYYDQHKSLFYDPKTGIYYYYDYDSGEYLFHSQIELQTQNQAIEKSSGKADVPQKKKYSESKKSTKMSKKNRSKERYPSGEKVFKNRKERRKAELERRLNERQQRRDDRYRQSDKRERGRKRRRHDEHTDSIRDRSRDQRSSKSHSRGHRSAESHDIDESRRKRTDRFTSKREGKHWKYSKVSESHRRERDVQLIEEDKVENSEFKTKDEGRSGKSERSSLKNSRSRREEHLKSVDEDESDAERNSGHEDLAADSNHNSKVENDACALTVKDYEIDSENELMIIDELSENEDEVLEADSVDDMKNTPEESELQEEMENKENSCDNSSKDSGHRSRSNSCRRNHKRESRETCSTHSEESVSEVESGELSDTNTEQSSVSESYSSYYSDTSEEESYVDIVDNEEQEEQEVAGSYPPCIRVMVMESEFLPVGTLYIITCTGGKIGRENCDICIPDLNVSKVHAEIRYNESARQYEIFDLASQNGTFLNTQRLSPAKIASEPFVVNHDDNVLISSTKLLCHIHTGYDTCDQCEPGVVIATYKAQQPQTEIKVMSKEERLRQKKQELNQIKKRYGLKNSAYEDNQEVFNNPNYTDKAGERRKVVGSDVPGQKQEAPASVHRPISTGNVGHKLLQKMGWKEGDTLGKNNTGIQEPISVTLRTSQKAGLGSASAGTFSADDANTVDIKKASRRIQAQQRYKQIESEKCNRDETVSEKQWTQGDTEFT